MTPLQLYHQQLQQKILEENFAQEEVINFLNQLHHNLSEQQSNKKSHLGKIRARIKKYEPITGLYLWGEVGAGKTHLINLFFQTLSIPKIRQHFHAFMLEIQKKLTEFQGEKNPLHQIAKQLATQTSILILDEFFVVNIADAMILSEFFRYLLNYGMCLVITSNIPPDKLYLHGLQRERFLPAIELIKKNTEVIHLDVRKDYRRQYKPSFLTYYFPLDETVEDQLEETFYQLTQIKVEGPQELELFDRKIKVKKFEKGLLWCGFYEICGRPRSPKDYLELTKRFHTIIISDLPCLINVSTDLILSFIYLIDILYDEHIRVILAAEVPLDLLYPNGQLRHRFQRTESRLIEMQSPEYFFGGSNQRDMS